MGHQQVKGEPGRGAASIVERAYPSIARWVMGFGWIEIGRDLPGRSFIRALDEGGLVWEGDTTYPTIDAAMRALDAALTDWMRDQLSK